MSVVQPPLHIGTILVNFDELVKWLVYIDLFTIFIAAGPATKSTKTFIIPSE